MRLNNPSVKIRLLKTPFGIFNSNKEAVIALAKNKHWSEIYARKKIFEYLNMNVQEYFYIDIERITQAKPYITPKGKFNSIAEAAVAYELTIDAIKYRSKIKPQEYYYAN